MRSLVIPNTINTLLFGLRRSVPLNCSLHLAPISSLWITKKLKSNVVNCANNYIAVIVPILNRYSESLLRKLVDPCLS
jgi:hypothetical protein